MKTTDEWMAETMQPIIDRIGGDQTPPKAKPDTLALLHPSLGLAFTAIFPSRETWDRVMWGDRAKDGLPPGCDGCRVDASGNLICCVNQGEEE